MMIQWLTLLVFAFLLATSVVSAAVKPRLGAVPRPKSKPAPLPREDLMTFNYTQTLDHVNYRPDSFTTFQQRYLINSRYWGGANTSSPIFVYLGAENSIDDESASILDDYAPRFNALLVFIEHRYYGKSVPFGSWKEAYSNTSTLGYFNSAQALADYAEVIVNLKNNLSAHSYPVIVVGGSYGGMLASWFRLKYPHIALGALASSAPILNFDYITPEDQYYVGVTKDFKETSESCCSTIRESWSVIDNVASDEKHGLSLLTQKFKTCSPISNLYDLKTFLEYMYYDAAQYDAPPIYPVSKICNAIDGVSEGTDILTRILAGVVASKGEQPCYDLNIYSNPPSESGQGWNWQTCTDLIYPAGTPNNNTMFEVSPPFDLHGLIEFCRDTYGVTPRPHWIVTEFGGHDIKLTLQNFASNIILSNGLRDPYSGAGVLQNISDSVVAIYTANGSHCLDIQPASPDDPKWLVAQRTSEINVMKGWITKYNSMRRNESTGGSNRGQRGAIPTSKFILILAFICSYVSLLERHA